MLLNYQIDPTNHQGQKTISFRKKKNHNIHFKESITVIQKLRQN